MQTDIYEVTALSKNQIAQLIEDRDLMDNCDGR